MSIAKPFTFASNTFAKSSEVNANFDVVYSQVNTNISDIAQNATDIENLNTNKANINGNASKTFAVANPVNNSDAINKGYLLDSIGNTLDYISGLVITKDNDNTIIVSAGTCYDSGKTVLLKLNNDTSKTNSTQTSGSTYYVYLTSANASGTPVDITISQDSVNPGTTKYRQIGYYKAVIGKSMEAYIVSGSTAFTSGWLSATDGGSALIPDTDTYYVVKTAGEYYDKIYRWNGSAYSEVPEISSTIGDIYYYGSNSSTPQPQSVLVETYSDGYDWYRIYTPDSTGYRWCEQGGHFYHATAEWKEVAFLKPFINDKYNLQVTMVTTTSTAYTNAISGMAVGAINKNKNSFKLYGYTSGYDQLQNKDWFACGYIN